MSTRTSIRPRPVDLQRPLTIVRDVSELDKTDDLDPTQAPTDQALPAGPPQKKKKEVKEIPVPEVRIVASYTRDYLPLFRIPDTYIRGKGGVGWARDDYVEYDLDNEDEDWLEAFNGGPPGSTGVPRLAEDKFEAMLYRLEVSNAEANQHLMGDSGATDWRMLPVAVASVSNLQRADAIAILRKYIGGRESTLQAVYDYWRAKRERWNKPILRRLQAPTNPNDTNPYNVFRPRERVNRPQTRRRRENTQDCLDKLRQIRESMLKALELTELLVFREARKRDIQRLDMDMQRYQIARLHRPRAQQEAVEAEAAAALQETQARSKQGEARLRAYLDGGSASTSYDAPLRRALLRKRRRQELEGSVNAEAVSRLPPPPLPPDEEMLHLYTPDLTKFLGPSAAAAAAGVPPGSNGKAAAAQPAVVLPPGLDVRCTRTRVSRCGRVMITRCDPLTLEPHPPATGADGPSSSGLMNNAAGGSSGHGSNDSHVASAAALAARHPLLHSAQLPSLPWAAVLDFSLLPEGVVDKVALKQNRERRLNADRNNANSLRQAHQALFQQAAGGMMGAAGLAGAAAAAAAAAQAAAAAPPPPAVAAAAAAPPAAANAAMSAAAARPPPPPAAPVMGAPAGTTPHVPPGHHGASTPAGGAAAGTGGSPPGPGGSGGAVRKVTKVVVPGAAAATPAGAAALNASRSPSPGGAVLGSKASTSPNGEAAPTPPTHTAATVPMDTL